MFPVSSVSLESRHVRTGSSKITRPDIWNVDDQRVGQSRRRFTTGSCDFPSGSFPFQYPLVFPSLITAFSRRRRCPDARQAEIIECADPIGSFSSAAVYVSYTSLLAGSNEVVRIGIDGLLFNSSMMAWTARLTTWGKHLDYYKDIIVLSQSSPYRKRFPFRSNGISCLVSARSIASRRVLLFDALSVVICPI